jgi:hypothetical protein
MTDLPGLVDALTGELERPRDLSPRVLNYIGDTYSVEKEGIGAFLVEELPKLEDYEIDLILSPVFTPKLADQTVFADLLGRDSVPREQWPAIIQELVARPIRAQLVTLDGKAHTVVLREVTIERYVHRLRLEATIPDSVFKLVDDRPMLKAIARRGVWESEGARGILERFLSAVPAGTSTEDDALDLLSLMENRKPANLTELLSEIPQWRESLRHQIEVGSGPKPFFSQEIERRHGGGRDQRAPDDARVSAKQQEYDFLGRLQQILPEEK